MKVQGLLACTLIGLMSSNSALLYSDTKEIIQKVQLVAGESSPTGGWDAAEKGVYKGIGKAVQAATESALTGVVFGPTHEWLNKRYEVLKRYVAFKNYDVVLTPEEVAQMHLLISNLLEHVLTVEFGSSDDYVFMLKRVQDTSCFLKDRLSEALQEYQLTLHGKRRPVAKRVISSIVPVSGNTMRKLVQTLQWMTFSLDKLCMKSEYNAGFDKDAYKKFVAFVKADLDILFEQLSALV